MSVVGKAVLSALYIFSGFTKLSDRFDYMEQVKLSKDGFKDFATVFPLSPLGFQPDPDTYMTVIGSAEFVLGLLLLLGTRPLRRSAALGLMAIMVGAIQTLSCLGKYPESVVPIACFLGLYYIRSTDRSRDKDD